LPADSLIGQRSAPRLQGTAALHANNGNRNPDPSLEGARSLGAALGDEGIDWSQQMHGSICQGFNPKTETDLIADYTDTIRYDYNALKFCHEKNLFKIGEIGGICGFNFGI